MKAQLIDTHCHLYLDDFREDLNQVLKRANEEGVDRFYMPSIDSETTSLLFRLESEHPGVCQAMIGLHPCSVKANYKDELRLVQGHLANRSFAAIGEIGLD